MVDLWVVCHMQLHTLPHTLRIRGIDCEWTEVNALNDVGIFVSLFFSAEG